MKNFSFLGCVINIILYAVYVFISMLIVGMIYGAVSGGQTDSSVMDKIAYLIIALVLIVTTIFRKFFYKRVWSDSAQVVSAPKVVKTKTVEKSTKKENGKMKIYVDKEIK